MFRVSDAGFARSPAALSRAFGEEASLFPSIGAPYQPQKQWDSKKIGTLNHWTPSFCEAPILEPMGSPGTSRP